MCGNKLVICTRRDGVVSSDDNTKVLAVDEQEIGKCRGCMRCRILKQCVSYNDDAQKCIPLITSADCLELYLQPEGHLQRLMDRVLYALNGKGKTFSFRGDDRGEEEYLRRLLVWAGYTEEK
ncbi:MAG: hypothetical protein NC113_01110 [Bacteroides sp.]|nr:hypothetical protein [Bacteroides sp.]MCM1446824.1 hypothetical protein [Bacteroides sp.]